MNDIVSRLNQFDVTDTNHVRQELNLPDNCTNYQRRLAGKTAQWRAVIDFDNEVVDLGLFTNEGEALKKYWLEHTKFRLLKESNNGKYDIEIGGMTLKDFEAKI